MGVSVIGLIAVVAIIVLAAVAYLFSRIVVVPSNLTGLISGSNRGTVKIVHPGGRDFVLPIIQTIQYLPFTQTTIGFKVTAEDENKINVNVAAVAAVKVGAPTSRCAPRPSASWASPTRTRPSPTPHGRRSSAPCARSSGT